MTFWLLLAAAVGGAQAIPAPSTEGGLIVTGVDHSKVSELAFRCEAAIRLKEMSAEFSSELRKEMRKVGRDMPGEDFLIEFSAKTTAAQRRCFERDSQSTAVESGTAK